MKRDHLDLLWIELPENIYYFTGCSASRGMLFIFRDEACLALDSRYFEQMKKKSPIRLVLDYKEEAYDVLMQPSIKKVGIEYIHTNLKRFEIMKKVLPAEYIDTSVVKRIRAVKDEEEMHLIEESSALLWKGYQYILTLLKEGVKESELGWEFEKFIRERGAEGVAFEPTIAFGESTAFPHYKAGKEVWKPGSPVLMDLGVKKNQYASDMTRTHLFPQTHPQIHEISRIVRDAYEVAVNVCSPGIPTKDIDAAARSYIEKNGYGEFFLHSLGHGVGLNVHEYPLISAAAALTDCLELGMVFTIEPGIYLPGIGGVRYENTLVLTEDGPRSFFPHDKS